MERSEGDMSLKNPVTPPGIDPGTVRLLAQRLNHYAIPGPKRCTVQVLKYVNACAGQSILSTYFISGKRVDSENLSFIQPACFSAIVKANHAFESYGFGTEYEKITHKHTHILLPIKVKVKHSRYRPRRPRGV